MGLFGFGKKKAEKQGPGQEESVQRWKDAYRANPQIYQKKDCEALMGACTLTEGVDTLLPLRPENQWAVDGKPVQEWILCLVSITEKRILGQIEYQEAMSRLRPFSLAMSEGWVLIRAMTHTELDRLLEGLPRPLR